MCSSQLAYRVAIAFIAAFPVSVGSIAAQVRPIDACTGQCSIEMVLVAALGDTTGQAAGFVGRPQSIARTRDGSFLVVDRNDQERLKRFSARGAYLGHVGKRGEGPGEFQVLQFVHALPGDSVETVDLGQRRVTLFTPEWQPVRTTSFAASPWEAVRLLDGSLVVAGYRCEPRCLGLPLHHIDPAGKITASFGAEPPVRDPRDLHAMYRQVTKGSTDGSIWSAHVPRYRLEEWSFNGTRFRSLERRVNWFPGSARSGYITKDNPPAPGIQAIHRDSSGVLWVLIHVADRNWRSGLGEVKDPYGRTYLGISNATRYFDSVIEAIDPARSVVLGSLRIDQAAEGFTQDGLLFGYEEAESGEPFVPLWRLSLPRRS